MEVEREFTVAGVSYDRRVSPPPSPCWKKLSGKQSLVVSLVSLYIVENSGIRLLASLLRARWTNRSSDKKVLTQFAGSKPKDLVTLRELAEAGEIRAAIDRCYSLESAAEARAYVDTGRRKGAVILTLGTS